MGKVNWMGINFESNWLIETQECTACRERKPLDEILGNGMCKRCTDIENNMMERLAGKWGQMVMDEENTRLNSQIMRTLKGNYQEEKRKSGWSSWL